MNEITRKGANALVAAVDFFTAALAAEAQAGEEKQKQLDLMVIQLKDRERSMMSQLNELERLNVQLDDVTRSLHAVREERDDAVKKLQSFISNIPNGR